MKKPDYVAMGALAAVFAAYALAYASIGSKEPAPPPVPHYGNFSLENFFNHPGLR